MSKSMFIATMGVIIPALFIPSFSPVSNIRHFAIISTNLPHGGSDAGDLVFTFPSPPYSEKTVCGGFALSSSTVIDPEGNIASTDQAIWGSAGNETRPRVSHNDIPASLTHIISSTVDISSRLPLANEKEIVDEK